ncbi:MAG TPA: hypothetical protein VGG35_01715 [Streptosporangiaceae bacterium]
MVLLVLILAGVVIAVYAADRVWKARTQIRRLHKMNDRLAAATARADRQQVQLAAREQASAELTAFIPAISRPPSSLPAVPGRRKGRRAPSSAGEQLPSPKLSAEPLRPDELADTLL